MRSFWSTRLRRRLTTLTVALGLTILAGIAVAAPAAAVTGGGNLGSGENLVARVTLEYGYVDSTHWSQSGGTNGSVWNPTGNSHGLLYAAIYAPSSNNCGGYAYMGAITDGSTKFLEDYCTVTNAPITSSLAVQIDSIGESGGLLGRWCVRMSPNAVGTTMSWTATGGAC